MTTRRQIITLLGSAAAAWPVAAWGQQPAMPVIGFLYSYSLDPFGRRLLAAFREGLKETGYEEGRNVAIEYRVAEYRYDRLVELAAELVRRRVTVICAAGNPSGPVAKSATAAIPIVFATGDDPVKIGLVSSLNRPAGNLTGVSTLNAEVGPKRLQLLRELVPTADAMAFLVNPSSPGADILSREMPEAARTLGLRLHILHASSERDFDAVFASLARLGAGALLIGPDPFFNSRIEQLAELALRQAVPTTYQYREFAAAGGLMSYGGSITSGYRLMGVYTGRILKGEKPADLPVQQSTKVELIINLKTAKALGLTVPLTLLGRADEVIE
jgi:putative ABC transport system substrate-binding protein